MISSPFVIILSDTEKAVLAARAASARAEHREVVRARIVLAAAQRPAQRRDGRGIAA